MECFAKSGIGVSHIKKNKPCQDASGCFSNEKYHLAVAADGHGSEEYFRSDRGSKFAVEVTHSVIESFMKEHTGAITDIALKNIEKNIIEQWRKKVLEDIKTRPWTPEELSESKQNNPSPQDTSIYGTTLLATVVADQFWFAMQIGDGTCVIIDEYGAQSAVKNDESQGMGSTHSLCEQNALEHFRHSFGKGVLLGATVATDGVADAVPPDNYLFNFTMNILKAFVENPGDAKKELETVLPKLSQMGSQDDVSIACIFNVDAARPRLNPILEISKMKLNYKTMEKENTDLKKKFDITVKDAAKVKTELTSRISDLTRKNSELTYKVEQAEGSLKDEQSERQQTEKDRDALKKRCEAQEQALQKEQAAKASLEREKTSAKAELDKKEKAIQTLINENQELNSKIKKLKKDITDSRYAQNQYEKQLEECLQKEVDAERTKKADRVPEQVQKAQAPEPAKSEQVHNSQPRKPVEQEPTKSKPEPAKTENDSDIKKKKNRRLTIMGWGLAAILLLLWLATLLVR